MPPVAKAQAMAAQAMAAQAFRIWILGVILRHAIHKMNTPTHGGRILRSRLSILRPTSPVIPTLYISISPPMCRRPNQNIPHLPLAMDLAADLVLVGLAIEGPVATPMATTIKDRLHVHNHMAIQNRHPRFLQALQSCLLSTPLLQPRPTFFTLNKFQFRE